jgi:hypothetical protein
LSTSLLQGLDLGFLLVRFFRQFLGGANVGHSDCGRRIPIDLDAMLANLALEEAGERLPQIADSIQLDPKMLWQTA